MSSLEFRGVTYPSAKVACDQLNISYADFNRLVDETDQSDLGCIEILYKDKYEQPESRKKLLDKPVSIKNFKYKSVREACKMLNLCPEYVLLTGYVNKQDLDEAIKMLQRLHIRGFIDSTPSLKKLLEKYSTAKDPVVAKAVNDIKPESTKSKDNVVTKNKEAVAKLSEWIQDAQLKVPEIEEEVKPVGRLPGKKGRPGTTFEFEGNTYSSIAEFCKIWELRESLVSKYRSNHPELILDEVLKYFLNKKDTASTKQPSVVPEKANPIGAPTPIVYKGVTYDSVTEFAKAFGYSSGIVSALRNQHPDWTDEQIYDRVAQGKTTSAGAGVEFRGVKYKSVREALEALGIPHSTYDLMRSRNPELTPAEVIEKMLAEVKFRDHNPLREQAGAVNDGTYGFTYKGVYYKSGREFCRKHGSYEGHMSTLHLKHPDWTQDQLCDYIVNAETRIYNKHHIEYKGEVFTSVEKFAVHLGFWNNYYYKVKVAHPDWTFDEIIKYMKHRAELRAKGLLKTGRPKTDKKEVVVTEVEPVINVVPSNPVEETTAPKNVDPAIEKLRAWRLAGQRTKMELVGAADMSAFKAWKDTAVETVLKSGPVYPDKVNAPWLKIDDVESVIDQACADIVEIAYLVAIHNVDLMKAINLCRADTELDVPAQEELDRLQAEVKSLRESVDSLYCKDCGDLIAPQFSEAHPGTCYCQRCYDKHNSD